ncbi:hypothetical protein [Streptomyces sp. NPDC048527]|uniref:hypothetical protein n=1 Tax=Streptomyces sp. NPDC048527 TaxID=3365568 RepID=UPI003721F4C7
MARATWPPRLTPTERLVLLALSEGADANNLHAELGRTRSHVMRAIVGLQRTARHGRHPGRAA